MTESFFNQNEGKPAKMRNFDRGFSRIKRITRI
jgi:hypothetical protein